MGEESTKQAGKEIAHAPGRHAGMPGAVVVASRCPGGDEGAAAFEQKGGGILLAKGERGLAAGHFF